MMHTISASVQGFTIEAFRERIENPRSWGIDLNDNDLVVAFNTDGYGYKHTVSTLADQYGTPFIVEATDTVHGKMPPFVVTATEDDEPEARFLHASGVNAGIPANDPRWHVTMHEGDDCNPECPAYGDTTENVLVQVYQTDLYRPDDGPRWMGFARGTWDASLRHVRQNHSKEPGRWRAVHWLYKEIVLIGDRAPEGE